MELGEHDGFFLINGGIKATFEHPFLIRRDHEGHEAWGFCAAKQADMIAGVLRLDLVPNEG